MTDKPTTLANLRETLTRREGMLAYPQAHWTEHDIRIIEASIVELKQEIAKMEEPDNPGVPKFGGGVVTT